MCQSGSPVITGRPTTGLPAASGIGTVLQRGVRLARARRRRAATPPLPRADPAASSNRLRIASRVDHEVATGERRPVPGVLGGRARVERQQQRAQPIVHAGRRHLPCAGERGQGVAAVAVGDEPARQDEVLGIRELRVGLALTLPSCPDRAPAVHDFVSTARLRGAAQPPARRQAVHLGRALAHSHSMVPGGLLVTSSTTRLTSRTSFVMRFEMRASTSYGKRVQSAVIASSDETGRSTIGCP